MRTDRVPHRCVRIRSTTFFKVILFLFLPGIVLLLSPAPGCAKQLSLAWSASPEQDLAGYRVYRSQLPGVYIFGEDSPQLAQTVPAGSSSCLLTHTPGGRECFVVNAFDLSGNESGPSNEACYVPPAGSRRTWDNSVVLLLLLSDDDDDAGGD
jgi:hypothetical protein